MTLIPLMKKYLIQSFITFYVLLFSMSAGAASVRDTWMNDPYPDVPNEVSDQDILQVTFTSINKIFAYLNSPAMAPAYKVCKEKEIARGIPPKVAPSTCLLRTIRRATIDLNLGFYGQQAPKNLPQKANDEQANAVQYFKVAKALQANQLGAKFQSELTNELSMSYVDWGKQYIVQVYKPEEANSRRNFYGQVIQQYNEMLNRGLVQP